MLDKKKTKKMVQDLMKLRKDKAFRDDLSKMLIKKATTQKDTAWMRSSTSAMNEQVLNALIVLFSRFEKGEFIPQSSDLRIEIEKAIKTIENIESLELKRRNKYYIYTKKSVPEEQAYRSYFKSYIEDLDFLLRKNPIHIGITFESYLKVATSGNDLIKAATNKKDIFEATIINPLKSLKKLESKENLPALRFYPLALDIHTAGLDDQQAKQYLTYGLFHYAQQLIHGNYNRPRKCLSCKDWFLATNRSHAFCSDKCRYIAYGKSKEGKENRKNASKKYRKHHA